MDEMTELTDIVPWIWVTTLHINVSWALSWISQV